VDPVAEPRCSLDSSLPESLPSPRVDWALTATAALGVFTSMTNAYYVQ
jgi:hypothetical protein